MTKGRPSDYSDDLATRICDELAKGITLRRACRENEDFPHESTVRMWAAKDYNGFYTQYAKARDIGLDAMADDLFDIADDGSNDTYKDEFDNEKVNTDVIARSRLRVDTRKWYLSKMAPKRYGDKLGIDHSNSDGSLKPDAEIDDEVLKNKLKELGFGRDSGQLDAKTVKP